MPVASPVCVFVCVNMSVSTSREPGLASLGVPQCPWGKGRAGLTLPRSRMKQSPVLKLSQDTGTSVARTTRRPLTWKSLCTTTSLGTTCLNPDATPPFCWVKQTASVQPMGSREAGMGRGRERVELKETLAYGLVAFQQIPYHLATTPLNFTLQRPPGPLFWIKKLQTFLSQDQHFPKDVLRNPSP